MEKSIHIVLVVLKGIRNAIVKNTAALTHIVMWVNVLGSRSNVVECIGNMIVKSNAASAHIVMQLKVK